MEYVLVSDQNYFKRVKLDWLKMDPILKYVVPTHKIMGGLFNLGSYMTSLIDIIAKKGEHSNQERILPYIQKMSTRLRERWL